MQAESHHSNPKTEGMDKRNCHILIVGGETSALESREYDVLLMDLNYTRDTTSEQEGLDLPARIQSIDAMLPVIVITAWSSVELAVKAMRRAPVLRKEQRLEGGIHLLRADGRPRFIQIAESHRGSLSLLNRDGPAGFEACMTLPF